MSKQPKPARVKRENGRISGAKSLAEAILVFDSIDGGDWEDILEMAREEKRNESALLRRARELEQQLAHRTATREETKESLEAWAEQGRKDFARIAELGAENARLREALTAIEDCQVDCHCPPECCGCEEREMKRIAIVALAPQPAPEAKPDDLGLTRCPKHGTYRDASEEPCWQCQNEKEAKPGPNAPCNFVAREGDPNHDMTIGPCQCGGSE